MKLGELTTHFFERAIAGAVSGLIVAIGVGALNSKLDISVLETKAAAIEIRLGHVEKTLTEVRDRVYNLDASNFATKDDLERTERRLRQVQRGQ